ncbi:aromatic hydrocarbon degradation protein [Flavobacterium algicola]|uniref:aromatic hydrocarbon degradation protein n=1 Tax=Flavobacterium algicola TaxID=556529 RepID=UPI001EFECB0F|nr:aromatic hydrocarbon degradation protein [Flavobacterium algicola]MCG9791482.1 aromatic hydrocarbon degradation protein [Flavobacterium algicola]
MKIKIMLIAFIALITNKNFGQSVSSSPYSLFGVGTEFESDFGSIPGLGSSGIALPTNKFINNLNPASLGFMYQNHFLFDVGGKAIVTTYQDVSTKEKRNNVQFSHIAFAFPISKKSGVSLALKPYSSSSYSISNLSLGIKDSDEFYTYSAAGTGGLNDLDVSYGYRLSKRMSVGATGSVLFGNASVDENYLVDVALLNISKTTNYNGVRLTLGTQYAIDSTFTIAATIKSPSKINASKVASITSVTASGSSIITSEEAVDVNDYYMPTEIAIGLSKSFKENFNATLDYQKSFWSDTNQSDSYGVFTNQDKFAAGLSFEKSKKGRSYFDRFKYSMGFNYDTGYLEIDSKKIQNTSVSIGVSVPLDNMFSMLNVSYSYGQKGSITNGLIKENYHKLSLNLSLDGFWFVKRKFE